MIAVVGVNDIDMVPIVVAVYIWFAQKFYLRLLLFFFVILDVVVDIAVVNDVVVVLLVVADHIILNCGQ